MDRRGIGASPCPASGGGWVAGVGLILLLGFLLVLGPLPDQGAALAGGYRVGPGSQGYDVGQSAQGEQTEQAEPVPWLGPGGPGFIEAPDVEEKPPVAKPGPERPDVHWEFDLIFALFFPYLG